MAFPPNFMKKKKKDPALADATAVAAEAKSKFPPKGSKGKKKKGNPFKSLPGGPATAGAQASAMEKC